MVILGKIHPVVVGNFDPVLTAPIKQIPAPTDVGLKLNASEALQRELSPNSISTS